MEAKYNHRDSTLILASGIDQKSFAIERSVTEIRSFKKKNITI